MKSSEAHLCERSCCALKKGDTASLARGLVQKDYPRLSKITCRVGPGGAGYDMIRAGGSRPTVMSLTAGIQRLKPVDRAPLATWFRPGRTAFGSRHPAQGTNAAC
jgi:hypothetical protein